jgi:hypothetical protein
MESKIELLKKEYPELFFKDGKETCQGFSIGDGWIPIVRCLCESLLEEKIKLEDHIKTNQLFISNYNSLNLTQIDKFKKEITEKEKELKTLIFLQIVQIKEKFGGLKLYTNGVLTEKQKAQWEFAYNLSSFTCEECGKEGTTNNSGWIRTLCDEHRTTKDEK